jgi:tRNA (guanine37-N1)-methyltransferase
MRIDILTIFPEFFAAPLRQSILGRAIAAGLVEVYAHNLRDWAEGKHHVTDDYPFGGGPGMVMKPEPFFRAVEQLRTPEAHVVLLSPAGRLLTQQIVRDLAAQAHLILLCGHYEGVDERVAQHLANEEISIGDYVLSGGEPAALVVVDAVVRLVPGALGSSASAHEESFSQGLLEYPQYTRPASFRGMDVPAVLLSGDHARIAAWRRQQALLRTQQRRPDLLTRAPLSPND